MQNFIMDVKAIQRVREAVAEGWEAKKEFRTLWEHEGVLWLVAITGSVELVPNGLDGKIPNIPGNVSADISSALATWLGHKDIGSYLRSYLEPNTFMTNLHDVLEKSPGPAI